MSLLKKIKQGKHSGLILAVALTLVVVFFYLFIGEKFTLFNFIELKSLDVRFVIRGEKEPSDTVGIMVADDYSIETLGRWPWPRSYYAEVLDLLVTDGARVVGFDIIFSEPEANPMFLKLRQLKYLYDQSGITRQCRQGSEFAKVLEDAITFTNNDTLLADAMSRSDNIVSPIVLQAFTNAKEHKLTLKGHDTSYKDLAKELAEDKMSGGDNNEPPAELLGGGMDSPDDFELGTGDDYIPEEIKASAFNSFVRSESDKMFEVPFAEDMLLQLDEYIETSRSFGFVNFFPDDDGALRWDNMIIESLGKYYPPIGLQMVKEYKGLAQKDMEVVLGKGIRIGDTLIPTDKKGRLLINYYGPFGTLNYYPIADLLDGNFPEGTFKDKIILIGVAATGLGDVWLTPFDQSLPGVEKHATVISNILNEEFLVRNNVTTIIDIVMIIVIGLALGLILPKLNSLKAAVFTSALFVGFVVFNFVLFIFFDMWANFFYPILNLLMVSVGIIVIQYFGEEKEKKQIKKAFKRYLNPALVEQLADDHTSLKLGGEEKELTVLFSDIRGFTSISEGLSPEQLVALINEYLSLMTKVIMDSDGIVDKFIGDAIMAVYGAPVYFEDHPIRSVDSAVSMMVALKQARSEWRERGFPDIRIGIGINTGPMVVGNMGSEARFDYTVMGDSVNLASRLEGLCKTYGAGIIISESTAKQIKGFVLRELDLVRVKGKSEPITIYEVVQKGSLSQDRKAEFYKFTEALHLYREQSWREAIKAFNELAVKTNEHLYKMYLERCKNYLQSPPDKDWDGVFTFTKK
ncbi:CHASE2 domain-containing protein [Nitrospirota bacterium]